MRLLLEPWAIAILVGIFGQLLKFLLYGLANGRLSLRVLVATNGMPSLYALVFGCLGSTVLLEHGLRSPAFVACFVLSGMILHDSIRLRGSMDRGNEATHLLLRSMASEGGHGWIDQVRPLLGDRRHRPLHVLVGLALGSFCGLLWRSGVH